MIEVTNITKIYGKKHNAFKALDEVTFEIPDGATVAVVGKSGSGKSTLMHIMSGLDHPTRGSVSIGRRHLQTLRQKDIDRFRAREMSFIFQAFFIEPNQTCYQNVMLPLEIAKVSRRRRKKMALEALAQVELAEKAGSRARDLSGGQKQRLAIARAIVNKPKLIFADEPTGNLDSVTGEKIIQLLFSLNKSLGSTLIIVTHDPELARRCQMQIVLKDGRVEKILSRGGRVLQQKPPSEEASVTAPRPAAKPVTKPRARPAAVPQPKPVRPVPPARPGLKPPPKPKPAGRRKGVRYVS